MKKIFASFLSIATLLGSGLQAQTVTIKNNNPTNSVRVVVSGSPSIVQGGYVESLGTAVTKEVIVAPGATGQIELTVISKIEFPDVADASYSMMYSRGPRAYSSAQNREHKYTFTPSGTIERGLK